MVSKVEETLKRIILHYGKQHNDQANATVNKLKVSFDSKEK